MALTLEREVKLRFDSPDDARRAILAAGATREVLTGKTVRELYDVDADVQFHDRAGHLTVVPVKRIDG